MKQIEIFVSNLRRSWFDTNIALRFGGAKFDSRPGQKGMDVVVLGSVNVAVHPRHRRIPSW